MKKIWILGLSQLAVAYAMTATGATLDVDWKVYGFASVDGSSVCFYDGSGIVHKPDGHIRVWTKCLLQKDIDGIDIKKDFDGKILDTAAQKMLLAYVPPIAKVDALSSDQILTITEYEVVADIGNIQPRASIFYELNCSEKMLRQLSVNIMLYGKSGSADKPGNWQYVPPESNGASLLKILCSK